MDVEVRAELQVLRSRAYGPDADIDEAALARLIELEEAARGEHAADAGADAAPSVLPTAAASEPRRAPEDPRVRGLRRWVLGVGAVVLVASVAVAWRLAGGPEPTPQPAAATGPAVMTAVSAREAYSLARDADAVVILRVSLDLTFRADTDIDPDPVVPSFPASGPIRWASLLGEYYGWRLWLAGAEGAVQDEQCLVVQRGADVRGRCVPAVLRRQSALVATLPYDALTADERPSLLGPAQRLGYWWDEDDSVTIVVADRLWPAS